MMINEANCGLDSIAKKHVTKIAKDTIPKIAHTVRKIK